MRLGYKFIPISIFLLLVGCMFSQPKEEKLLDELADKLVSGMTLEQVQAEVEVGSLFLSGNQTEEFVIYQYGKSEYYLNFYFLDGYLEKVVRIDRRELDKQLATVIVGEN